MDEPFRFNGSGAYDPTAAAACTTVQQEMDEDKKRVKMLVGSIRNLIELAGYDLLCRIEVRDRKTGRSYR